MVTSEALAFRGVSQQLHRGGAFDQEEPHVAIWFRGLGSGLAKGLQGLLPMSLRVPCQSLQYADLDGTSGASKCVGGLCSRPSRRLRDWSEERQDREDRRSGRAHPRHGLNGGR